ncbi:MAG: hypothetical protein ACKOCM_05465 [Cyanobacteriota bacterium]
MNLNDSVVVDTQGIVDAASATARLRDGVVHSRRGPAVRRPEALPRSTPDNNNHARL